MDYIIFDLEWNRFTKKVRAKCPDEIIQIGAVKYDENMNFKGKFNALIKPSIYNRLEPMVQEITGISIEMLKENGIPFPKAFKEFRIFMGENPVLMSWGTQDISILKANCIYYNRDISLGCFKRFADLQYYVSRDKKMITEQNQIGLKTAADVFNIVYEEDSLHDALFDAELSGKVFEKTFDKTKIQKHITDGRKIMMSSKGVHITDLKANNVNKREFLVRCPSCGRFATKILGWYRRDKSFFAIHKCKCCNKELLTNLDIIMMFDESIKYKKKTCIIEKTEF